MPLPNLHRGFPGSRDDPPCILLPILPLVVDKLPSDAISNLRAPITYATLIRMSINPLTEIYKYFW